MIEQAGYELLSVEQSHGVTRVEIRHEPINLIDRALFRELRHIVRDVSEDRDTRVFVLASALPGFFLAHVDVGMIKDFAPVVAPQIGYNSWHTLCETLRAMPAVSIAEIAGRCGGGGQEISLAFDMRFAAAESAVFNQPEVALGLVPLGGGTTRLARLAGRARALEALLGCDDFDATTAAAYGWVNRALPEAELTTFVKTLATRIAAFPPFAVAAAKASVNRADRDLGGLLLEDVAVEASLRALPETMALVDRFLEAGGQTPEGESDLARILSGRST